MTVNDVPEIRAIFEGFAIEPVALSYTLKGNDNAKPARELIVTGGGG